MGYPRHALVSPETTPYYHCVSRCVRRALLCGIDHLTGRSYEHRKQWVVDRLHLLSQVFTIDICAYAVMANHHHLVLRIDCAAAETLSQEQVIARWSRLYALPVSVERYRQGLSSSTAEAEDARALVERWRQRLRDLSWFMRCLNESIARRANAEDGCSGRFWEGRFKSQALLDEAALITCMSYVDLNPVRAGLARTPEASAFTSIQARVRVETERSAGTSSEASSTMGHNLLPFRGWDERAAPEHLPLSFTDYLQLLDWAGRAVREDKPGTIPAAAPPVLARLGIEPVGYVQFISRRGNMFSRALGRAERLREAASDYGQKFLKGIGRAQRLFPSPAG